MERFKELISNCKSSVYLTINNHKSYNQSIEEYIKEKRVFLNEEDFTDVIDEIGEDVYNKMIEMDFIVEIQAYPDTSNGSFSIYHYDIDKAIEAMIICCEST